MKSKTNKTPLEKLQAKIDSCNERRGCDSMCSKTAQAECELLRKHTERMSKCLESDLPIELW